jgi:hypothetical protein
MGSSSMEKCCWNCVKLTLKVLIKEKYLVLNLLGLTYVRMNVSVQFKKQSSLTKPQ